MPERLGPYELERVARVFPRRTKATPRDPLAFVGDPGFFLPPIERVMVSCAFTWDIPEAERLAKAWERVAPVQLGGPAFGKPEGDFEPGMFLRDGYVITSRGCPNRCWFCHVWRRQPAVMELPIRAGWIVQDDNLLACSEAHVRAVFAMLAEQPRPAEFTGGLEAARLEEWHVEALAQLQPQSIYLAYDTPADCEPLIAAARLLRRAGLLLPKRTVRCYVLIGYPGDALDAAEERLEAVFILGLTPFAMLYFDGAPQSPEWRALQRRWASADIIFARHKPKGSLAEHRAGQGQLFGDADGQL